jgi:hypothetical protein
MILRIDYRGALLIALALMLSSCEKKAQQINFVIAIDTSIRTVKWDSLLAHDKTHFENDSIASAFGAEMKLGPRYHIAHNRD